MELVLSLKYKHRIECFCVSRFILTLLFQKRDYSFFKINKHCTNNPTTLKQVRMKMKSVKTFLV